MATMDLSGLLNPRRVIQKREDEADEDFAKRKREAEQEDMKKAKGGTVLAPEGMKFGKQYTKSEREAQDEKLKEMLKKRK